MLATLYAKALDADAENPVLGDTYERDVVRSLDYDWTGTGITPRLAAVTMRTAHFDDWARQFLAAHDAATVLHLGCGLDSRFFRLQPGPNVIWQYDVTSPWSDQGRRRGAAAQNCEALPSGEPFRRVQPCGAGGREAAASCRHQAQRYSGHRWSEDILRTVPGVAVAAMPIRKPRRLFPAATAWRRGRCRSYRR
jgi:hypothetical protein